MYEEFFRFSTPPFRLNPDPKFFFGSRSHNKAMAYLHYGLRQGEGFIVITGEIGAGKSMLISHLMDQLDRSNVVAAHLLTTNLEPSALLSHILSAFRVEPAGTAESAAIEAFEDFLFDQMNRGRRVLLIVDEAQNLPVKTIEELRMLSNMDYDGTPLFQVFLVGQPEFRSMLSKPEMEQFRQRVIASYHLEPLSQSETIEYIKHRLSLVGWTNDPSIADDALPAIFKATDGVPRKINKLCNRILLFCALEKRHAIDVDVVNTVVADLEAETLAEADASKDDAPSAAAADEVDERSRAQPPSKAEVADEAVSEKKTRRVASGGANARRRSSGGEKETRAPVVIPFEHARKVGTKDADRRKASDDGKVQDKPVNEGERKTARAPSGAEKKHAGGEDKVSAHTPPDEAVDTGQMSVLDRLRARRHAQNSGDPTPNTTSENSAAATLTDVARAIAEAAAGETTIADAKDLEEQDATPAFEADPVGWRRSMVKSINETREDLRAAHSNLSQLRGRLSEGDSHRRERRRLIATNLERAESLLTEIEDSWR